MFDLKDVRPKGFKRTRRVNGEKVIEFTAIPMPENESTFDLIVEEASVNALGDKYIIKKLSEQSRGKTYIKNVTAIHKFFVDLINKQQPKIHNGSITFNNYMNLVFEDTPYTFVAIDHFPAREFENLGNDNRLALLQKGLDRFQAEFELVGNQVRFYKQIGNDTDFQFRYGHNIKAISVDIDTTNLATRIRGTGDPELGIEAEYISPNSAIYGIIDAPPVNDERFKYVETLLEEMKRRLIDEPEISITVDFVDLRAAGYPYTVPNEGDRVWLIYEPMNDLLIETRIIEIVEYFKYDEENDEFVIIKTEVTLSNDKKTFAGTMFDNVRKQLRQIVNDDGIIRYSALDEAVKIATEALHSAQTELEFNNGIIAREKTDPNRLVILNSAGLGISKDGGQTFQEAITADGFVLSVGAVGRLSANHIQIGPETEFEPGYDPSEVASELKEYANTLDEDLRSDLRITSALPTSITMNQDGITAYTTHDPNAYARLDHRGLYIKGGAIQIEGGLPDDQIKSSDKWNKQGTFIDDRGVYTGIISANQLVGGILESKNSNTRFNLNTGQLTMQNAEFVLDGGATIRFRAPSNSLTYSYGGRRAGIGFGNSVGGKAITFVGHTRASDPFAAWDSSDFHGFVSNAAIGGDRPIPVNTVVGQYFRVRNNIGDIDNGFEFNVTSYAAVLRPLDPNKICYLGVQSHPFTQVTANEFVGELRSSSSRELKKNIKPMSLEDSLQFIKNTKIVSFNWKRDKTDLKNRKRVGFIIEELNMDNEHYVKVGDNYKLNNIVFMQQQVIQYLLSRVEKLEERV